MAKKFSNFVDANPSVDYKIESKSLFENRVPCEWLSTEQAAAFLSLTPNALRICVHRGQVRAYKFGRRLRFRVEELRRVPSLKGI